ncbi:protein tyrosine phosphatase [Arthrobacter sp. R1-13]
MSLFTVIATSKVAASALAAGALAVGGTGAAAYAGALPTEVQQSAHELLGAPAPHVDGVSGTAKAAADAAANADADTNVEAGTGTEAGTEAGASAAANAGVAAAVDAAGPAAYGLCTAFTQGGLEASSEGFVSLSIAAGGETGIESYCAGVIEAGKAAGHVEGQAEVSGSATAKVEAPAVPELPTQAAVPAAPELPVEVPTEAADVASSAVRP